MNLLKSMAILKYLTATKGAFATKISASRACGHSLQYEEVYLKAYDSVREAKMLIGNYFGFFNHVKPY